MSDLQTKLIKAYTYWDRAGDRTRFITLYAFVIGRYGPVEIERASPSAITAVDNGLAWQKQIGGTERPEDCAMMQMRSAARCVQKGPEKYHHTFIGLLELLGLNSVVDEYFSAAALVAGRVDSLSIS